MAKDKSGQPGSNSIYYSAVHTNSWYWRRRSTHFESDYGLTMTGLTMTGLNTQPSLTAVHKANPTEGNQTENSQQDTRKTAPQLLGKHPVRSLARTLEGKYIFSLQLIAPPLVDFFFSC